MSHDIEEWLRKDIENLLLLENNCLNLRDLIPDINNGFRLYQQNPLFCSLQDETLVQISRHARNLEQSFHQYEIGILKQH